MSKKKFFCCIGNPPYQDDTSGGNDSFAPPLYNVMMDAASTIADRVEMITPARFLFNAGSTPKAWNEKKLNDPHFKVMEYHADASKVFPRTDIAGGVAVTYHDDTKIFEPIRVFVPDETLSSIFHKVISANSFKSLSTIVRQQNKFVLEKLYDVYPEAHSIIGSNGRDRRIRSNAFEKLDFIFKHEANSDDDIRIYGIIGNKRTERYIDSDFVDKKNSALNKYKVVMSAADGAAGTIGNPIPARITGTPFILSPNEGITQTFQSIGSFDTKNESESACAYMKTKFVRALIGIVKVTQSLNPTVFSYVPLQDFTSSSDIDWSQSVADIDRQLYEKYGLDDDEIAFIEKNVKAMP